jgi:hypothetical protein
MKGEVWVPCFEWENHYEVSNHGNVRSLPRSGRWTTVRPIKPCLVNGYPFVKLHKDSKKPTEKKRSIYVHRLMLEGFTRQNPKGLEAAHRNGIQTDNRLENLYWATRLQNEQDKTKHGTRPCGKKHKRYVHGRYCKNLPAFTAESKGD